jgi:mRNA-degrading endonuclease RelE of RelBE toxin-antitoxin system
MFTVLFNDSALEDLRHLTKASQQTVLDAVERQLRVEPTKPTRNRKPLNPNNLSEWELRVGVYRVFYDVDQPATEVVVKAVGWKQHNKLLIRGQEYTL